jgi:hypothetical protein
MGDCSRAMVSHNTHIDGERKQGVMLIRASMLQRRLNLAMRAKATVIMQGDVHTSKHVSLHQY